MSEMVERVARAIMVESGCGYSLNGEHVLCDDTRLLGELDPYGKPLYRGGCDCRASARAAIEAMREPTETMLDASWTTCIRRPAADYIATELASPRDAHRHKTRIRHRAMIDASLHEGEAGR